MHRFANPARFLRIAKPLTPALFWPGLMLTLIACIWGLFFTPTERLMGDTVKILFVHVPAAWLGMGGWTGIAIASIVQLVWRHPLAGVAARAIAVPGATFAAICLGYIALSNASSEKGDTSRVAAVFGIIGAINIPIINRSVIWWESQHQKASITLSGSSIDSAYLAPLFVAVAGFSLLFGALVLMRMRAALADMRIEARMRRMAEG